MPASVSPGESLAELVTEDLAAYEAAALRLAREPARLQTLRQRLDPPHTFPLFDAARFCGHMEDAYTNMWRMAEAGAQPRSFAVEPRA